MLLFFFFFARVHYTPLDSSALHIYSLIVYRRLLWINAQYAGSSLFFSFILAICFSDGYTVELFYSKTFCLIFLQFSGSLILFFFIKWCTTSMINDIFFFVTRIRARFIWAMELSNDAKGSRRKQAIFPSFVRETLSNRWKSYIICQTDRVCDTKDQYIASLFFSGISWTQLLNFGDDEGYTTCCFNPFHKRGYCSLLKNLMTVFLFRVLKNEVNVRTRARGTFF